MTFSPKRCVMSKREIVSALLESPFYLDLTQKERRELIERLSTLTGTRAPAVRPSVYAAILQIARFRAPTAV
jgi:hypothetical protein